MIKIQKKYDAAIAKITKRIDVLRVENDKESERIGELEEAYAYSVVENDGLAAKARVKLKEHREIFAERQEQIELLEAGTHPVMIKAANDAAIEYAKEYEKHEAIGDKLKKEAIKAKDDYVEMIVAASTEDGKNASKRNHIKHIFKNADNDLLEKLGIKSDVESVASGVGKFFHIHPHEVRVADFYATERGVKS